MAERGQVHIGVLKNIDEVSALSITAKRMVEEASEILEKQGHEVGFFKFF